MTKKKSTKQSPTLKCKHCKKSKEFKTHAGLVKHYRAKHPKAKLPQKPIEQPKKKVDKPAIGKKLTKGGNGLTPQQEMFCQLYASDKEFFGNGVQSYIEAYDIDVGKGKGQTSYETCRVMASRLLTSVNILNRINEIFEGRGLNDAHVDKQLEFLITQKSEMRTSLGAIQEYNKLKQRITDKVEHTFSQIKELSDDELKKKKDGLLAFFQKK